VTKTSEEERPVNQQVISGRRIFIGSESSGNSSRGVSSTSSSRVSTPHGGGSTKNFTMAGQDPTIRLLEFQGEGSNDLENHLFIYENIWEAKQTIDEYTKVVQLETTLRDHALNWYMGLEENNPTGAPTTIEDVKKKLINEFHKPSS
jgi:hypothetical protein